MSRPLLLIASRQQGAAVALHEFFDLFLPQGELIHRLDRCGFSCAAELFEQLDRYQSEQLRDLMVLFDLGTETAGPWNVEDIRGESGLATQLVLAYPEVYFVFISASGPGQRSGFKRLSPECQSILDRYHFVSGGELVKALELVELHALGFRTIFDATGLRSYLKRELQEQILRKLPGVCATIYQPVTESRLGHAAMTADEEASFLYLNGYGAYKFGLRSWLAHTKAEFCRLLAPGRASPTALPVPGQFRAALVDWHLAYRDDETHGKAPLAREVSSCGKVGFPIFVTSFKDQVRGHDPQRTVILAKPYGGFFTLLAGETENRIRPMAEVFNGVGERMDEEIRPRWVPPSPAEPRPGPVPEDSGTPPWAFDPDRLALASDLPAHSAPYGCSVIAGRLLARALALRADEPSATEAWVQGAVLAGEAKEILGGLSRTTAYEALALQNEAEVRAEVSFYGIEARIKAKPRLADLEREADFIHAAGLEVRAKMRQPICDVVGCPSARPREWRKEFAKEPARLNFLLQTANNLRARFTEHEQVEAAEECLRKFARYERTLRYGSWLGLFSPFHFAEWWVDWFTRAGTSVWRLLWGSMLVIGAFAIVYFYLLGWHPKLESDPGRRFQAGMGHSLFTFMLQPGIAGLDDLEKDPALQPDFNRLKEEEYYLGWSEVELGPERHLPALQWKMRWVQWYRLVMWGELGVASLHIGLLISLLYRRITKRAP
ncbi:MAG: hypothetical protein JO112_12865 [Planctomycetes bacterium]|nr:hypothetical protein [Planctomycetota bacterium]